MTLKLQYELPEGPKKLILHGKREVEQHLKSLARRSIAAELYVSGESSEKGGKEERVGGVDFFPERAKWDWWYDLSLFEEVRSMVTLELCYTTPKGAGVVRYLHDEEAVEKALKSLHRRHVEADLYVSGDLDEAGNRTDPVGGVTEAPGVTANGRHVEWQWWFEVGLFAGKQEVCS